MRKIMGKWRCSKIFQLQPWYVSMYAQKTSGNGNAFPLEMRFCFHSTRNKISFPLHSKQNSLSTPLKTKLCVSTPLKTKFCFRIILLYKPQQREGYGVKKCLWDQMVIFLLAWVDGILQSFTNFYLHRKFLIFLRNDHDCKAIEALNIFEKQSWL